MERNKKIKLQNTENSPSLIDPSIFGSLPPELQLQIFSYLDYESIRAAKCVCRQWRDVFNIDENSLVRTLSFDISVDSLSDIRDQAKKYKRIERLHFYNVP